MEFFTDVLVEDLTNNSQTNSSVNNPNNPIFNNATPNMNPLFSSVPFQMFQTIQNLGFPGMQHSVPFPLFSNDLSQVLYHSYFFIEAVLIIILQLGSTEFQCHINT